MVVFECCVKSLLVYEVCGYGVVLGDVVLYCGVVVVLVEEVVLVFVVEWVVWIVYLVFVGLEVVCCLVGLVCGVCCFGVL